MLLDKTMSWADGSQERVQIGDDGFFSLDGVKRRLVGVDFVTILDWYTSEGVQYWVPEKLLIWEKELMFLEAAGVRYITFNPRHLVHWPGTLNEEERWSSVFDLLYEHKMLVLAHIEGKGEPGFDNLTSFDFGMSGPADTMGAFATRFADCIAKYPNIVGVVLDNELNFPLPGQDYTPEALGGYLDFLGGIIRPRVNVPMVQNLVGRPSFYRPDLTLAGLDATDWPCFTMYAPSVIQYDAQFRMLTDWLRAVGHPSGGFWVQETDAITPLSAADFTAEWIETAFNYGASVVCLHATNYPNDPSFAFFTTDGDPIPSMVAIAAEIPRLQAPIIATLGPSAAWTVVLLVVMIAFGTFVSSEMSRNVAVQK